MAHEVDVHHEVDGLGDQLHTAYSGSFVLLFAT